MKLRVALGADHGGFILKNDLFRRLRHAYEISDLGTHTLDLTDNYPDFGVR